MIFLYPFLHHLLFFIIFINLADLLRHILGSSLLLLLLLLPLHILSSDEEHGPLSQVHPQVLSQVIRVLPIQKTHAAVVFETHEGLGFRGTSLHEGFHLAFEESEIYWNS
jgi:hypothetical protein